MIIRISEQNNDNHQSLLFVSFSNNKRSPFNSDERTNKQKNSPYLTHSRRKKNIQEKTNEMNFNPSVSFFFSTVI